MLLKLQLKLRLRLPAHMPPHQQHGGKIKLLRAMQYIAMQCTRHIRHSLECNRWRLRIAEQQMHRAA